MPAKQTDDSLGDLSAGIERLRGHLRRMKADGPSMEHLKRIDLHRKEITPQVANLLQRFLEGQISLEEFKLEFQANTPKKWESFAINGAAGGMLLNVAVKYIKNRAELTTRLRAVLKAPEDTEEARKALNNYVSYLLSRVESKELTANFAGIGRVPFFVSVFWHAQKPEQWPIFYPTTRKVLAEEKLFKSTFKSTTQTTGDAVADYFSFCKIHQAICDGLDIDSFELEYLCIWLARSRK